MPIKLNDIKGDFSFEYHDTVPNKPFKFKKISGEINATLLYFYGLYRTTVIDSYKQKPDLARDIKEWKMQYQEKDAKEADEMTHLYHYGVTAALGAMQDWKDPQVKLKSFIAYDNQGGKKTKIGFVHFEEKEINQKKIVYIASAGTSIRGQSIGRGLMECVLAHYPAGTEFYIGTRIFNTEAKILYGERLKFSPLSQQEVQEVCGLDARYCGFKRTTTVEEIDTIRRKQIEFGERPRVAQAGR